MHSTNYTYDDEKNNRTMDIDVHYAPVPYTSGNFNEPPYGGFCEDFDFKVLNVTVYDAEGNLVKNNFTKEELQAFTKEFDEIFDGDEKLQKELNDICMEDVERYYDDEGSCYDDDDYGWLP